MRGRIARSLFIAIWAGSLVLFACVGDDPDSSPSAGSSSGSTSSSGNGGIDGSVVDGTGPTTDGGADATSCTAPQEACGTSCFDLATNQANCGKCGHACASNVICRDGHCANEPVDVALATDHSCAALAGGDLWCWGDNQRAQLGKSPKDGGPTQSASPLQTPAVTDVARVFVGYDSTCVVKRDHTVWCWGYNVGGNIGHEPGGGFPADDPQCAAGVYCNPTPIQLRLQAAALLGDEVIVGTNAGCARLLDGKVACWGHDACGNFGVQEQGTGNYRPPTVLANVAGIKHLATSGGSVQHMCAIKDDGTVICWGSNGLGECGHAPESTPPVCLIAGAVSPPTVISGLSSVTSLSIFGEHSCAVANGKVLCWGENAQGVVAPGTTDANPHPTPTEIAVGGTAVSVSVGAQHACARLSDDTVKCWGNSMLGRLGIDGDGGDLPPVTARITKAKSITAGDSHTAVIDADQLLDLWGSNNYHQLGQASGTSNPNPTAITGLP